MHLHFQQFPHPSTIVRDAEVTTTFPVLGRNIWKGEDRDAPPTKLVQWVRGLFPFGHVTANLLLHLESTINYQLEEASLVLWTLSGWGTSLWNLDPFPSMLPRVGTTWFRFWLLCFMVQKSFSICGLGVFVDLPPLCILYFYICMLHSNRDFMHQIKLFPPISLGLAFCWIIQPLCGLRGLLLDKFTTLRFPFHWNF